MTTVSMPGRVFSAETLAASPSITVPPGSVVSAAIKTIRNLVLGNNVWVGDLKTMQTIAMRTYEINKAGASIEGDDSFVVTMNGEPLIIRQPNGNITINTGNNVDFDRVSTRVVRRSQMEEEQAQRAQRIHNRFFDCVFM